MMLGLKGLKASLPEVQAFLEMVRNKPSSPFPC